MQANSLPVIIAMLILDAALAAWVASGDAYTACLAGLVFGPIFMATQLIVFETRKRLQPKPTTHESRS